MLTAHLDESYDRDHYYVGAAIATDDVWASVETELEAVRQHAVRTFGLDPSAELHGHCIMGGRDEWKPLRGRHREAGNVVFAALAAAHDAGVKYIFRGVHVPSLNDAYDEPDHPHSVALEHVMQRLDKHAGYVRATEPMRLVADTIDLRAELQGQFDGYQKTGTRGYWPSTLKRLKAPIEFEDSRSYMGLQLVDLAVYLYRRRETVKESHPNARRMMARLMGQVDPSTINGSGTWYPVGRK